MPLETELKAVVDDLDARRAALQGAGARLVFEGRLEDRRYDTPERELRGRDHVLRLRTYRSDATAAATRSYLDWKGETRRRGGFKLRDEITTKIDDPSALDEILLRLGYIVTLAVDRRIVQYEVAGATVRFEIYPRMDCLVEVEGEKNAIARAIEALGMPRAAFTDERLSAFVRRYEERTGDRAALSDAELAGGARHSDADA